MGPGSRRVGPPVQILFLFPARAQNDPKLTPRGPVGQKSGLLSSCAKDRPNSRPGDHVFVNSYPITSLFSSLHPNFINPRACTPVISQMADLAPPIRSDRGTNLADWDRSRRGIILPRMYLGGLCGIAGVKTIIGVESLSNDLEARPPSRSDAGNFLRPVGPGLAVSVHPIPS